MDWRRGSPRAQRARPRPSRPDVLRLRVVPPVAVHADREQVPGGAHLAGRSRSAAGRSPPGSRSPSGAAAALGPLARQGVEHLDVRERRVGEAQAALEVGPRASARPPRPSDQLLRGQRGRLPGLSLPCRARDRIPGPTGRPGSACGLRPPCHIDGRDQALDETPQARAAAREESPGKACRRGAGRDRRAGARGTCGGIISLARAVSASGLEVQHQAATASARRRRRSA